MVSKKSRNAGLALLVYGAVVGSIIGLCSLASKLPKSPGIERFERERREYLAGPTNQIIQRQLTFSDFTNYNCTACETNGRIRVDYSIDTAINNWAGLVYSFNTNDLNLLNYRFLSFKFESARAKEFRVEFQDVKDERGNTYRKYISQTGAVNEVDVDIRKLTEHPERINEIKFIDSPRVFLDINSTKPKQFEVYDLLLH